MVEMCLTICFPSNPHSYVTVNACTPWLLWKFGCSWKFGGAAWGRGSLGKWELSRDMMDSTLQSPKLLFSPGTYLCSTVIRQYLWEDSRLKKEVSNCSSLMLLFSVQRSCACVISIIPTRTYCLIFAVNIKQDSKLIQNGRKYRKVVPDEWDIGWSSILGVATDVYIWTGWVGGNGLGPLLKAEHSGSRTSSIFNCTLFSSLSKLCYSVSL